MRKLALLLFALTLPSFAQAAHSVSLTCTDADLSVTGYHFFRSSTSGNLTPSEITLGAVPTCAFVDTLVSAGQTWYYTAKANNLAGDLSNASNEFKAILPPKPVPPVLTGTVN